MTNVIVNKFYVNASLHEAHIHTYVHTQGDTKESGILLMSLSRFIIPLMKQTEMENSNREQDGLWENRSGNAEKRNAHTHIHTVCVCVWGGGCWRGPS